MLRFFFSSVLIAAACLVCIVTEAVAQEPSQAQRDAIRASCRSDFIANCSGVQPGGKDAFECLKRNEAKLSASCKTAVNAVVPAASESTAPQPKRGSPESPQAPAAAPAAATAQSQEEQLKIVRSVCTMDDFMAHCSWIAPNSPELLLCLKGNASNLSPACQQAVRTLAAEPAPVRPPPAADTSQPAPVAPAPAAKRTEPIREAKPAPAAATPASSQKPSGEQLSAIRAACRSDFIAQCSGVQPGSRSAQVLAAKCGAGLGAVPDRACGHRSSCRQRLRCWNGCGSSCRGARSCSAWPDADDASARSYRHLAAMQCRASGAVPGRSGWRWPGPFLSGGECGVTVAQLLRRVECGGSPVKAQPLDRQCKLRVRTRQ